jgi:hypothetical protein
VGRRCRVPRVRECYDGSDSSCLVSPGSLLLLDPSDDCAVSRRTDLVPPDPDEDGEKKGEGGGERMKK